MRTAALSVTSGSIRHARTVGFVVVGIVFLVFFQCLFFDFSGWDDALIITSNPRFNPPTLNTIWYYWTHPAFNLYMPMTCSLWATAAKVGEMSTPDAAGVHLNPFIFHLAGLICHLVATAAVYGILLVAVRSVGGSAVGAIAFGIHPLMVEPVEFIGSMCTPLAAALALSAVWLYLSRDPAQGRARLVIAAILYALSLLAKPMTVILPAVVFLLEIGVLHRSPRKALWTILPWIAITVPCVIWTKLIQTGVPTEVVPLWARPWIASDAACFYLQKMIWPFALGIDYGRTPRWVLAHPRTAVACLFPVGLLLASWIMQRRSEATFRCRSNVFAVAMVTYLVMLLPNSGLVPFDYQRVSTVADRYAYLGMFAVALVIADGLSRLPAGKTRPAVYGAAVCVLVFWAVVTTFQLRNWRNGITLFSHAVEVNPRSSFGFQCLAQAYVTADNPQAALIAASRSIELNPANEQYRAMVLAHPGAPVVPSAESASDWAEAAQAHITLANALDRLNRLNQAAEELTTAVSMNPGNVIAITDLAFVLGRSGHETQAQAMLHRALQIDPSFLPARNALRRVQPQSAK